MGALLIDMVFTTLLLTRGIGWTPAKNGNVVKTPGNLFTVTDFTKIFLRLDLVGTLRHEPIGLIFTLLLTDMFDPISTLMGVPPGGQPER